MFFLSIISVLVSSVLIGSLFTKNTKNNLGLIYIILIAFGQLVLSFEILSLLKSISTNGILICNLIFLLISILLFFKTKEKLYKTNITSELCNIGKALKKDKALLFLSFCFLVLLFSKLFEIFVLPVNFGDALGYYIPRALSWIQNGSITHFVTPDTRELIMPVNMEFLYCWILLFTKSPLGIGIFSYISFLVAIHVIYNLLGELGFCRRKRIWSCFVFSSFVIIAGMAKDPCADLFIGALLLCSIHLFYSFLKYKNKASLYFSTLAIALAVGTKTTAIIAFPSALAIFIILTWIYKKEEFKKIALHFAGLLTLNFIIFSAYNYILNFIQFGNFISCQEQFLLNKFRGGVKGYLCNLIKYSLSILDFSGINIPAYHDFINQLQIKILNLIGETPDSYTSKRFEGYFTFDAAYNTMNAALGAMGLFALLPSLCKSLSKKFSNKKLILNLLALSLIINILVFSRVMVFTRFNLRYLVTFIVIASPILVFSYIKSNKNLYKNIMTFIMFIYLFMLPHQKPLSFFFAYNNFVKDNPNIENPKEKILQIEREEKKIFNYFIEKEKTNIIILGKNSQSALSDIEELILQGFRIDKMLPDNYETYNIENYEYIITEPYKTETTNIQKYNAKHCLYVDNEMETTENKKLMATAECIVPFEYFKQKGFKKVDDINLSEYVILKK